MAEKRILVVDDDTIICKLLTIFLQRHGFDSHSAHSGEEALARLAGEHFFGVITDLKMGETSGQDIVRQIKKSHPETRVIMITGSCDESDELEAHENGVDDFFFKPFKMEAIVDSLNAHLR